jgi:hypothetical protein
MKTLLLFFGILLCSIKIYAQDLIIKKNGDEIQAKVLEILPELIKYKKKSNLEGPTYTLELSEIFMIKYQNGSKAVFKEKRNQPSIKTDKNKVEEPVMPSEPVLSNYIKNRQHTYFAMAVGYGNSYGGYGLRLQGRFGKTLGFGIHGGVGYFPGLGGAILASGGLKFYPYKWIYINWQFGTFGKERTSSYSSYSGSDESTRLLVGPSVLIGGDFIFGKHFGFNVAGGLSLDTDREDLWGAIDIGFIFKF